MKFKEYRQKGTIRAAEITEESLELDSQKTDEGKLKFTKGDYVQNVYGSLFGWKKEDFEAAYAPIRAARQSNGPKRKRKVNAATGTNAF